MLCDAAPIGFISVSDFNLSRVFYFDLLGLQLFSKDDFALILQSAPFLTRLAKSKQLVVAPYTILGRQDPHIGDKVLRMSAQGIVFEQYNFLDDTQSAHGTWTAPCGNIVGWFKDTDGNLLCHSRHVG